MFDRLKQLYNKKMINESHLDIAISKGWITEEEKLEIVSGT